MQEWNTARILREAFEASGMTRMEAWLEMERRGVKVKQPNTISTWVRGKHQPRADQLACLLDILGRPIQLGGKPEAKPELRKIEGGGRKPRARRQTGTSQ